MDENNAIPQTPTPQPSVTPAQATIAQAPPVLPEVATPEETPSETPFYLTFGFWAFILFLGNLLAVFFLWIYPLLLPPILTSDQPMGEKFHIQKARVNQNGFVVLKVDVVSAEGSSTLVLASSEVLTPEVYEDFYVVRAAGEALPDDFLTRIPEGTVVKVGIYRDSDADGIFNPDIDQDIAKDVFGRKIQTTFFLR